MHAPPVTPMNTPFQPPLTALSPHSGTATSPFSGGTAPAMNGYPPSPTYSAYNQAIELQQSGTAALQIETQDGDTITLQMQSQWYGALHYSETNTPSTQSKQASLEQYQGYTIHYQVEGELDEAELAALDQVMQQMSVATNHFFNGELDSAISSLNSFQLDAEQFTALSISMQRSVSYSMAESYREVSEMLPGVGSVEPANGGLLGLSDYIHSMLEMMDQVSEEIEQVLMPDRFITEVMQQAIEQDPRSERLTENRLTEFSTFLEQIAVQWRAEQQSESAEREPTEATA